MLRHLLFIILFQVETKRHDHTILCIMTTVRADCGKYRLTVKNSTGEDSEEAELIVLDRPSCPQGPLQVRIVKNEKIFLCEYY